MTLKPTRRSGHLALWLAAAATAAAVGHVASTSGGEAAVAHARAVAKRPATTTAPAATVPASEELANPVDLDAKSVDAAIAQLADGQWKVRERAAAQLAAAGDTVIPALEAAGRSTTDEQTRAAVRSLLKRIADDRLVGPSRVTLHLAGVSPKKAFEELARQCSTPLTPFPDDLWQQVGDVKVSIDVDRQPFWVAMRSLSKQTGIDLTEVDGKSKLTQTGGTPRLAGRHATVAGPFLIAPASASLSRSVSFDADDPVIDEEFSLQIDAFPEPKLTVLKVQPGLTVREAVDDLGNSLLPDPSPDAGADQFVPSGGDGCISLITKLKRAAKPGSKLVRLRGTVGVTVQVESQKIEVKDLKALKNAERVVNGVRVVFNDLKKEQDQFHLRVTVTADPANPGSWEELQAGLGQRLRLLDAKGRLLQANGIADANSTDNRFDLTLAFSAGAGPEDGKPTGDPVRLVWEVPTKTRELLVPFELKDLKLP